MNQRLRKIFFACFSLAVLLCATSPLLVAQPANDNCSSASLVNIPNSGYGPCNNYTSASFDLTSATSQAGEFYATMQNYKSVWYKFSLPTTKHVTITLKQDVLNNPQIVSTNVGFAVYKRTGFTCLPGAADLQDPIAVQIGDGNTRRCLTSGDYFVQVAATQFGANGKIYLEFDVKPSSSQDGDTLYDDPFESYTFGTISNPGWDGKSNAAAGVLNYDQGCQSMKSNEPNISYVLTGTHITWTKTSWHVFKTDNVIDYFRLGLKQTTNNSGTIKWAFCLYEGDVRTDSTADNGAGLTTVTRNRELIQTGNNEVGWDSCCGLKPNTWYSIQIWIPNTYYGNVDLKLYEMGTGITHSPDPKNIPNVAGNDYQLGTLPNGNVAYNDTFSCNARMSLFTATGCPSTILASTVTVNSVTYDLSEWSTFYLNQPSNVTFTLSSWMWQPDPLTRIYTGNVMTAACNTLSQYATFTGFTTYSVTCMPAGWYTIEILGRRNCGFWDNLYNSNLAAWFTMNINTDKIPTEQFDLSNTNSPNIDSVNNCAYLPGSVLKYAAWDTFDCDVTILPPSNQQCTPTDRAMYRIFRVSSHGTIDIDGLDCYNFKYRLYKNKPIVSGGVATNLIPLTDCQSDDCPYCFWYCHIRTCLDPGYYTLVTYGQSDDVGRADQPTFTFTKLQEKYSLRSPRWQHYYKYNSGNNLVNNVTYTTPLDTFDCDVTPIPANGLQANSCSGYGNEKRAMYRVFTVNQSGWLTIFQQCYCGWWSCGQCHYYRLYKGNVGDTIAYPVVNDSVRNLLPLTFCEGDGCTQFCGDHHICIDPGTYTLVAFGDSDVCYKDIATANAPSIRFNIYHHKYGLYTSADYTTFNNLNFLNVGTTYTGLPDTFDCRNSRLPHVSCGGKQATYRFFKTNTDGELTVTGNVYLTYRLYVGTPSTVNLTSPDSIKNLPPYIDLCQNVGCFGASPSYVFNCLPVGNYCLVAFDDQCEVGVIDQPTISLTALPSNAFGLQTFTSVDLINNGNALTANTIYYSTQNPFGCDATVMPNETCDPYAATYNRAMYRMLYIPSQGSLTVYQTDFYFCHHERYYLYAGNARDLANAQGKIGVAGALITGLTDEAGMQHIPCWGCDDAPPFKTCVSQGWYTLVSVGGCSDVGHMDKPYFLFTPIASPPYITPPNAQSLTALSTVNNTVTSSKTWVDCAQDNALTIAGVAPPTACNKLYYRVVHVDDQVCLNFQEFESHFIYHNYSPYQLTDPCQDEFTHHIFKGNCKTGGVNSLTVYPNVDYFFDNFNNVCMDTGWYTIVTYAKGKTYVAPVYCTQNPVMRGEANIDTTWFTITVSNHAMPKYNKPVIAEHIDNWNSILWSHKPQRGHTSAVPVMDSIYCLNTEVYNACRNDLPFSNLLVSPCAPVNNFNPTYDRITYRVFKISKPSYVFIYGLNNNWWGSAHSVGDEYQSQLYKGNITTAINSSQFTLVQACIYNDMRINITPVGTETYTLVTYTTGSNYDWDCTKSSTPAIYIDSLGTSRFNYNKNAYDFDLIPATGVMVKGKVGDPNGPFGRAPSSDFFFSTTTASNSDPDDCDYNNWNCWWTGGDNFFQMEGDHDLSAPNQPMQYNLPNPTQPRRNLWYTFTADGGGTISVVVKKLTPSPGCIDSCHSWTDCYSYVGLNSYKVFNPPFAVFQSAHTYKDDSTMAQGLTHLVSSDEYPWSWTSCYPSDSVTFERACNTPLQRYYILVEQHRFDEPDVQIEVRIKFTPYPAELYNHYSTANHLTQIPAQQTTLPPYANDTLNPATTYTTVWHPLPCLTKDATDQNFCGTHTSWSTFYMDGGGIMTLSCDRTANTGLCPWVWPQNYFWDDNEIMVFKKIGADDDSTASGLVLQTKIRTTPWGFGTGAEFCYSAGRYYVMFTGCACGYDSIRYHIKFTSYPGDHCFDPMVVSIPQAGANSFSPLVLSKNEHVDCYTIGEGPGETTTMGCLGAPDIPYPKKTGWFRIDLSDPLRCDINIEILEHTQYQSNSFGFRTFQAGYANCGSMAATGECSTTSNNNITLHCRQGPTIIWVQVTMPADAVDSIEIKVTAWHTNDQCQVVILPVGLTDFDAIPWNNYHAVKCDWETYTEVNNDYFTVQRSADNKVWEDGGTVDGAGYSTSPKRYSFIDLMPYFGTSYYRLMQTDYDGNSTYSPVKAVDLPWPPDLVSIIPNPNEGMFKVQFTSATDEEMLMQIFNSMGTRISEITYQVHAGVNAFIYDINAQPAGVYYVVVTSPSKSYSCKVVKQ